MVRFTISRSDYLREVRANNAHSTFKTYQSMLNRYGRYLLSVEG